MPVPGLSLTGITTYEELQGGGGRTQCGGDRRPEGVDRRAGEDEGGDRRHGDQPDEEGVLDHVLALVLAHDPIEELNERLHDLLSPRGLSRHQERVRPWVNHCSVDKMTRCSSGTPAGP